MIGLIVVPNACFMANVTIITNVLLNAITSIIDWIGTVKKGLFASIITMILVSNKIMSNIAIQGPPTQTVQF